MEKTVLAIDPGTHKCGMAVVSRISDEEISLVWHDVVPTTAIVPKLHEAYAAAAYNLIIVGGGTHSKAVVSTIRDHLASMAILVVDEKDTTYEARERYWEHNPRRSWRRIVPSTLLVPPEPIDDYAALIIAERVLIGS